MSGHVTHLSIGKHSSPEDGICAMELEAQLAGEDWTDEPDCVCLYLAQIIREWNDQLCDEDRDQILLPLAGSFAGSRIAGYDGKQLTNYVAETRVMLLREQVLLHWAFTTALPALLAIPTMRSLAGFSRLIEEMLTRKPGEPGFYAQLDLLWLP